MLTKEDKQLCETAYRYCEALYTAIKGLCDINGYAISGHLYAILMTKDVGLEQYKFLLNVLIKAGLIELHSDHTITLTDLVGFNCKAN